jgi:hypothetical protein
MSSNRNNNNYSINTPFCGYATHVEYYEFQIDFLQRQRSKITRRGRLTAEEDTRLYEIDAELEELHVCLDKAWEELEYDSE